MDMFSDEWEAALERELAILELEDAQHNGPHGPGCGCPEED